MYLIAKSKSLELPGGGWRKQVRWSYFGEEGAWNMAGDSAQARGSRGGEGGVEARCGFISLCAWKCVFVCV